MKAAVYYETGPPEVLRYEDVADPVVYPGGVLIEVEAISIEGGDTLNRAGGEMPAVPARRRLPVRGHDSRGRGGRDRSSRRPARRRDEPLGLARRAHRGSRDHHVARARRRRHRGGRVRAGRVRHRRRLPLRVRPPAGGRDGAHPGRRRRRRHRRDPAREARGRNGDRDRVERQTGSIG